MEILNRSRQAYKNILGKTSDATVAEAIQVSIDLKELQETKGWKRIEAFMARQDEGAAEILERDLGSISLISVVKMFNTFLKFLYVTQEKRAYKKIRNFVRISIETGNKYAEKRAKEEARKA